MSVTRRTTVLLVVGLLVLTAGVAALGGWLWWTWWGPQPGAIYASQVGDKVVYAWYATPVDPGQAHVTRATFEFVITGFLLAVGLGVLAGLLGRNRAVVALATTALASVVGAYVMWQVGTALSPPDPSRWADKAHYRHAFPGHLEVIGWTPYLAWPVGMLFGFLCVMLAISGERRVTPAYAATTVPAQTTVGPASDG